MQMILVETFDHVSYVFNMYFYNCIYIFSFGCAGSSLLCRFFSSCSEPGLLFVIVCGLLTLVASLVAEHSL